MTNGFPWNVYPWKKSIQRLSILLVMKSKLHGLENLRLSCSFLSLILKSFLSPTFFPELDTLDFIYIVIVLQNQWIPSHLRALELLSRMHSPQNFTVFILGQHSGLNSKCYLVRKVFPNSLPNHTLLYNTLLSSL